MSKSFLTTTAILNIADLVVAVLMVILLKAEVVIHPLLLGLLGLFYILGALISRIFNTIYFWKDGYKLASFANIGLFLFFLIELVVQIDRPHEEYEVAYHITWSICNIVLSFLLLFSIFKTKKFKNDWLKAFVLINFVACFIEGTRRLMEIRSSHFESNNESILEMALSLSGIIFLVIHLLVRKNQSLKSDTNEDILDESGDQ